MIVLLVLSKRRFFTMILLVPPEDVSRAMQLFQEAPGVVHVYRMVRA